MLIIDSCCSTRLLCRQILEELQAFDHSRYDLSCKRPLLSTASYDQEPSIDCDIDDIPIATADPADYVALIDAIVKDRSRSAFAELFQSFAPKLKMYHRKGRIEGAIAEDLVQEEMPTIWRLADRYRPAFGNPSP